MFTPRRIRKTARQSIPVTQSDTMPENRIAENFFGTLGELLMCTLHDYLLSNQDDSGATCWSIQLIPQIVKSWRQRSTHGLSHWLV